LTAFRKSSTSAEEGTETFAALVPLYGSPVAESTSTNQIRRGEGGDEDCCGLEDAIFAFFFLRRKTKRKILEISDTKTVAYLLDAHWNQ
jgi:hypothetical protein